MVVGNHLIERPNREWSVVALEHRGAILQVRVFASQQLQFILAIEAIRTQRSVEEMDGAVMALPQGITGDSQ